MWQAFCRILYKGATVTYLCTQSPTSTSMALNPNPHCTRYNHTRMRKGHCTSYYPTRKQTWQSSHPYSSKSCWSIPRHYPKSKGIWGRSTYYTVINTGSNSCLIALFTCSSPVFFFFAIEEKAWTISSHTCWHTLCDLCVVWITELSPTDAVFESSSLTVLEAELPCWLLKHLMLLNMRGRSPWEATTNSCESWQQLLQHEYRSTTN